MKIKELQIAGFRSLKEVRWQPGDLNVIIGPNGSGKSNLLRTLEMISVAAEGNLSKLIVASGGMGSLVWDGKVENIDFHLTTSRTESTNINQDLEYGFTILRLGTGSSYRIETEVVIDYTTRPDSKPPTSPFLLDRSPPGAVFINSQGDRCLLPPGELDDEIPLLSRFTGPFVDSVIVEAFRANLASWCIYHDLNVGQDSRIRQATVAKFETRLSPNGQNLISVLHTLYTGNRTFKDDLNAAMTAAFGDDFEELTFPPDADGRVQMRIRWKTLQREQSAAGLSDGTLRFLFLVAALANPSPPSLIAIDEPETGLHPGMLPIIAELAVSASRKSQVIFTTHSPQFLDAFEVRPTTTVATWENGETKLSTLADEQLEYWLKEYSLGHLFTSGDLENLA